MAVNSFIAALGNILEGASSDRERTRKLKELEEEREYAKLLRKQQAEDREYNVKKRTQDDEDANDARKIALYNRRTAITDAGGREEADILNELKAFLPPPTDLKRLPIDLGIKGRTDLGLAEPLVGPTSVGLTPSEATKKSPLSSEGLYKFTGAGKPTVADPFKTKNAMESIARATLSGPDGVARADAEKATVREVPGLGRFSSVSAKDRAAALQQTNVENQLALTGALDIAQSARTKTLKDAAVRELMPIILKTYPSLNPEQAQYVAETGKDPYDLGILVRPDTKAGDTGTPTPLPTVLNALADMKTWGPEEYKKIRAGRTHFTLEASKTPGVMGVGLAFLANKANNDMETTYASYVRSIGDAVARLSEKGVMSDADVERYQTQVSPSAGQKSAEVATKIRNLQLWGEWLVNPQTLKARYRSEAPLMPNTMPFGFGSESTGNTGFLKTFQQQQP